MKRVIWYDTKYSNLLVDDSIWITPCIAEKQQEALMKYYIYIC